MKAMTRMFVVMVAAIVAFVFLMPEADARRLGGGRSLGKSSSSIFKRSPTKPAAANQAAGAKGAAAGQRRGGLMGPIAGLAAGLGLAALASYLGFGEELANMMMILLLVGGGLLLFRFLMARFAGARPATAAAGIGGRGPEMTARSGTGGQASPLNPGSAGGMGALMPDSTATRQPANIPADFDVEAFLRQAKVQFVRLQAVYDAGDLNDLRSFTSPEMFAELKMEVNDRGTEQNQTDVVTLNAELIGVESDAYLHTAAVHFDGMIREQADGGAEPFSEIWTLTKPVNGGSGWVLSGIEQVDGGAR